MTNKIIAKTTKSLKTIIQLEINMNGNNCDLNHIDVSRINDMNLMFYKSEFNGDISNWKVSNVTDMYAMFEESQFNGDLTKWLPYSLLNDSGAFKDCKALTPYWANFDNVINRNEAISKYLLHCELNSKLHNKKNSNKKHKI